MKLGIMQPYFFPYIGYFQLINAVDTFVFYDDVNYIKQGWVNRNRIIGTNGPIMFTIPLSKVSSFKHINKTEINVHLFHMWKKKFLKTLDQTYSKAPYFDKVFDLVNKTLQSENKLVSNLAISSIENISEYLDMKVDYKLSSKEYGSLAELDRTERLVTICQANGATQYINSIGGKELYYKKEFAKKGIELSFLKEQIIPYKQFDKEFIPGLSIIDVLMFNSKADIQDMLKNYKLV